MDSTQFDRVTRCLGTRNSRRAILAGLLGAVAFKVSGGRVGATACSMAGGPCGDGQHDCCQGLNYACPSGRCCIEPDKPDNCENGGAGQLCCDGTTCQKVDGHWCCSPDNPCTPTPRNQACAGNCGKKVPDGCGGEYNCDQCVCTPTLRQVACSGNCGKTVPDGCGGKYNCDGCPACRQLGEVCNNNEDCCGNNQCRGNICRIPGGKKKCQMCDHTWQCRGSLDCDVSRRDNHGDRLRCGGCTPRKKKKGGKKH